MYYKSSNKILFGLFCCKKNKRKNGTQSAVEVRNMNRTQIRGTVPTPFHIRDWQVHYVPAKIYCERTMLTP